MRVVLEIGERASVNRTASVSIAANELSTALLSIASADERNRSGYYMRRHAKENDLATGIRVGPNRPLRCEEPRKISIPEHLKLMSRSIYSSSEAQQIDNTDSFDLQPVQIVVPVSDVASNLLRPCYARNGLGRWRTFFFEDEPIDQRAYWAVCVFAGEKRKCEIRFMDITFDVAGDTVRSVDGRDLSAEGIEWAVALVPLVKGGAPVRTADIAKADYDLRQVVGRQAEKDLNWVYEGWYGAWNERVTELVTAHEEGKREFESFYHSVLSVDSFGTIHIRQVDANLPQLAADLAKEGMVAAGLLDSGGSCALFDPWLQGYLNHGWYFREARGAVMCFELQATERLPKYAASAWYRQQ